MAESMVDVYIKLLQLFIITFLLILLIRRERMMKIKAFRWFIIIFMFALLQGVIELIIYYIKVEIYHLESTSYFRFNELHTMPYAITIFIIYLLAENMISLKLNPFRLSLTISLLSAYLTLYFYEIFNDYSIVFDHPATDNVSNTLFDFYQFWVMSLFTYVHGKAWQQSKNTVHRKSVRILFMASLIYVLSILWELGEDLFDFPNVYGAITIGLSLLVLAFVYIKYPYFIFSVPSKVYRLIISSNFHHSLIFSAKLLSHEDEENSSFLFASAMSSITEFITGTTGADHSLNFIDLGNRSVIIAKGDKVSGIIVTNKPNRILRSALRQLVSEFEQVYEDKLIDFNANISQFEDCKYIVARCFPFIEPREIMDLTLNNDNIFS